MLFENLYLSSAVEPNEKDIFKGKLNWEKEGRESYKNLRTLPPRRRGLSRERQHAKCVGKF
jgi:hypothetical protein